tara:strand:+ start:896 stop:1102 length:207 start_codon:yes stop_codon:yes gene_type:complete
MKRSLLLALAMLSSLGIGCSSPQAGNTELRGDNREHWEWLSKNVTRIWEEDVQVIWVNLIEATAWRWK